MSTKPQATERPQIEATLSYWRTELEIAKLDLAKYALELRFTSDRSVFINRIAMTELWVDEIERNIRKLVAEWWEHG